MQIKQKDAANSFLLHNKDFSILLTMKLLIILSSLIGAIPGSFAAGFMSDSYGRRLTILLGVLLSSVGNTVCMFSYFSIAIMIVGRIIVGMGIGIFSSIGPIYSSEMESKRQRGVFVAVFQCGITFSMLISSGAYHFENMAYMWVVGFGVSFYLNQNCSILNKLLLFFT